MRRSTLFLCLLIVPCFLVFSEDNRPDLGGTRTRLEGWRRRPRQIILSPLINNFHPTEEML